LKNVLPRRIIALTGHRLLVLQIIPTPPRPRHIHLTLRPFDPSLPPSQSQSSSPNTLDIPLNRHAAEALADVLTSEWGLVDLKLEGGLVETEDALKPILHALLVSGTLPSLSLAGNRKIKAGGWRLLAVFLKKVRCVDKADPLTITVVCYPCSGPKLDLCLALMLYRQDRCGTSTYPTRRGIRKPSNTSFKL
jgi:hypothetical protein